MMGQIEIDHSALERGLSDARAESPARRKQIDAKLKDEPWQAVAEFASYCRQTETLHLMPWQPPPCSVGNIDAALAVADETRGWRAAALLRQRMERCGVSRFCPDPVAACEAAEAELPGTARREERPCR